MFNIVAKRVVNWSIKKMYTIDVSNEMIEQKKKDKTMLKKRLKRILCFHCKRNSGETKNKMKCCRACGNAYYCSKHCQKRDWIKHKMICDRKFEKIKSILKF